MIPEAAASPPARASDPDAAGACAHGHAWGSMRFELVDGRPIVRQDCRACGMVRRYRAFERYWTPGSPEVRRQDP